jgi:hypothetical protein
MRGTFAVAVDLFRNYWVILLTDPKEEVSSREPGRDGDIDGEEEVQPYALLQEEKRTEERARIEGDHVQPVDNSEATGSLWIVCQSRSESKS